MLNAADSPIVARETGITKAREEELLRQISEKDKEAATMANTIRSQEVRISELEALLATADMKIRDRPKVITQTTVEGPTSIEAATERPITPTTRVVEKEVIPKTLTDELVTLRTENGQLKLVIDELHVRLNELMGMIQQGDGAVP